MWQVSLKVPKPFQIPEGSSAGMVLNNPGGELDCVRCVRWLTKLYLF